MTMDSPLPAGSQAGDRGGRAVGGVRQAVRQLRHYVRHLRRGRLGHRPGERQCLTWHGCAACQLRGSTTCKGISCDTCKIICLQLTHTKAAEIEEYLRMLSDVNSRLAACLTGASDTRSHMLTRHRDILHDYTQVSSCCQFCCGACIRGAAAHASMLNFK